MRIVPSVAYIISPETLKPRLHDTICCQTGCQTSC